MLARMKLTILETGRPPAPLADLHPRYPDMFASLLARVNGSLRFEAVSLWDGEAPPDPGSLEAVLITGSPHGVYDPVPWIDPLRDFIRAAHAARTPMIGVCFGHQIVADALGGEVRKSEKGWGVGRHTYEVIAARPWMSEPASAFSLVASHQDQVIAPPAGAVTLARSAHTEHAMLAWDDAPILTLQGHPEFTDAFAAALYNARRGRSLTNEQADAAVESLARPENARQVAGWMVRFLRDAR
jgi:GMP synthase-like glutamine amidotransferase